MKKLLALLFILFSSFVFADEKEIINQINASNKSIVTLVGDSQLVIRKRALTFTLLGKFYFQKDTRFRMSNRSAIDNEFTSDIGSNETEFWFYGKRINRNAMYRCEYGNILKTRLKDSLNPHWMIEAMGVGNIKIGTIQKQSDGKFFNLEERTSTRRSKVVIGTLIDPSKPAIVGYYIFDKNSRVLGSITIVDSYKTTTNVYLPKRMEIRWPQEEVIITWDLSNVQINKTIASATWTMPNLGVPVIDLGRVIARGVND